MNLNRRIFAHLRERRERLLDPLWQEQKKATAATVAPGESANPTPHRNTAPTPMEQSRLARDLENSRIAMRDIAPLLYAAFCHYRGSERPLESWMDAPASLRSELIEIAETAVRSVEKGKKDDAQRKAAEMYRACVRGALRGVRDVVKVSCPAHELVINRVIADAEQALVSYTRDDIARAVVDAYERELRSPFRPGQNGGIR